MSRGHLFLALVGLIVVAGGAAALIPMEQCTAHHDQSPLCYNDYSAMPIQQCKGVKAALRERALGTMNVTFFAQIGDFGLEGPCPRQVRDLIDRLTGRYGPVDFIHSTGDNDYWSGHCDQMWKNIGQYYAEYIPKPRFCNDVWQANQANWSQTPRFWPTVGNHDWTLYSQGKATAESLPYSQYFSYLADQPDQQLSGLHYKVSFPNVDMYSLNSNWVDEKEQSDMMAWLKTSMATGKAPFQLVFAHHPAYSTAHADQPLPWLRQPYKDWNPNTVLFMSGHEHVYERIELEGQSYIINGLGGHPWRYYITECEPTPGSQIRFSSLHGAAIAAVTPDSFAYCFYSADGKVIDEVVYKAKN